MLQLGMGCCKSLEKENKAACMPKTSKGFSEEMSKARCEQRARARRATPVTPRKKVWWQSRDRGVELQGSKLSKARPGRKTCKGGCRGAGRVEGRKVVSFQEKRKQIEDGLRREPLTVSSTSEWLSERNQKSLFNTGKKSLVSLMSKIPREGSRRQIILGREVKEGREKVWICLRKHVYDYL